MEECPPRDVGSKPCLSHTKNPNSETSMPDSQGYMIGFGQNLDCDCKFHTDRVTTLTSNVVVDFLQSLWHLVRKVKHKTVISKLHKHEKHEY